MADPETPSTDAAAFLGALDVGIDLKLATPASRSLAYFIDLLILWLAGAVLLLVAVLAGTNLADLGVEPGPFFAALLIGWFSFEGLWFTCWEWLGGGRTPGKRAMGLRVVRKNGYAVGLGGALIRTLLRPIELGTSGSIAMLVASLTPLHQRLGDLAGGTLVIQDQQGSAPGPRPPAGRTAWPTRTWAVGSVVRPCTGHGNGRTKRTREADSQACGRPLPGLHRTRRGRPGRAPPGMPSALRRPWWTTPHSSHRDSRPGTGWRRSPTRRVGTSPASVQTKPSPLVAAHRVVVSDFAWARTRFPEAGTTRRLRTLAFRGHQLLAAPEPPALRRAWQFFLHGYPRPLPGHVARDGRRHLALHRRHAAWRGGGWREPRRHQDVHPGRIHRGTSGRADLDGSRGDGQDATSLSTMIFTNNIRVALTAWAGGAIAGLGTAGALLFNGLMFGCMLTVTSHYGLLDRLHAWVAAHGPLELFLICCAGGAGFTLAQGLVDDRGRRLSQTFAEAGRTSVQLALGTVPWFVLCGIVEGTLSPQMDMATALKQGVGVLMLAAFLVYTLVPRAPGGHR